MMMCRLRRCSCCSCSCVGCLHATCLIFAWAVLLLPYGSTLAGGDRLRHASLQIAPSGGGFRFLPVNTNPPVDPGKLELIHAQDQASSASSSSVQITTTAAHSLANDAVVRFTLGTGLQQQKNYANGPYATETDGRNSSENNAPFFGLPYLFAEHYPVGSTANRPPVLQAGLAFRTISVFTDQRTIVYQKRLDGLEWSDAYVDDRVVIDSALKNDVVVLSMHSLDLSVFLSVAVSSASFRESLRGGVISPKVSHAWLRVEGISPYAASLFNTRKNSLIELECSLCTAKKPQLVESPSAGRDSFISFKQKLKPRPKHKKTREFGFLSWDRNIKLLSMSSSSSTSSSQSRTQSDVFEFQDGVDEQCRALSFSRASQSFGDGFQTGAIEWGFGLGFGALPPFVESWEWYVTVLFVGALGIGLAACVAVFYVNRMRRLDAEAALQDKAESDLRFEFPETLRHRFR